MVSVIVPVYNVEKYLGRCIESILGQTYCDFELILVDDGSTDASGEICDEFALLDKRIKVIHQKNQGQAVARNNALDVAEGEFFAFVDSDDYIHPQMYEKLLENAKKSNAQISVGGYRNVYDHNCIEQYEVFESPITIWKGKDFLTHCLIDGVEKKPWVLWDKIFHRSCFEGVRMPQGRIYEDNAIVYKILYEAKTIVDCKSPYYYYYQNPEGTVNQQFKEKHLDWLLVSQEMIDYFAVKRDSVLLDKVNRMYMYALEDMYRKVQKGLNNSYIEKRIKGELLQQYEKEKRRYVISIKTHPGLYEILFPKYSHIYWNLQGIFNKFKRG